MIKSIENTSSANMSFDTFLSKLNHRELSATESKKDNKPQKQINDKFQKGYEISKVENKISELLDDNSLTAEFSTDKETEKLVLKLIDKETGKVVRQYPPEVTLKIARMVDNIIENDKLENAKN